MIDVQSINAQPIDARIMDFRISPGGSLRGAIRVPGDKSISHRAVMLGSIAEGETTISGLLEGEDVLATIAAMRAMGVMIEGPVNGGLSIKGVGLHGLKPPKHKLDMGNSGTAMRLLAGLLAGQVFESTLIGDASLKRRPMQRIVEPLRMMGGEIATAKNGTAPLVISPAEQLQGIDYRLPVASAQVKSALLLAGLYAGGETKIHEPAPTRDHTERMLQSMGCDLETDNSSVTLRGCRQLNAGVIDVPADISSAAFFLVGAAISKDSSIELKHLGVNPTRTGILPILAAMGCVIDQRNRRQITGEPVADLHIKSARLKAARISAEQVPAAIDEFPTIAIAAACATGQTVISGAEELRVKESDRIAAIAAGLTTLGIEVQEQPDGLLINGGTIRGGEVDSQGDHRIAMAFAMAGLVAQAPILIRNCANVATSFPGFVPLAQACGLRIEVV